jgi:hypothetical protein
MYEGITTPAEKPAAAGGNASGEASVARSDTSAIRYVSIFVAYNSINDDCLIATRGVTSTQLLVR